MAHPWYQEIRQIIEESSLWRDGREESHSFVLSRQLFHLSKQELDQLLVIGSSLYGVMKGLNRLIAFSEDQKQAKGKAWDLIRRVSRVGIPRYHRRVQVKFPEHYPVIFKVDLLRSNGKFWIVELDGVNTHGFGYTVLLNRLRKRISPIMGFRGVVPAIADHMHQVYPHNPLFCFVSSNSRFYEPYYRIMVRELEDLGISVTLAGEWMTEHEKLLRKDHEVVLQFPIFRGGSDLPEIFVERYEREELSFLIPPKTFMGSKAIMALLKNSYPDVELEEILKSIIEPDALETLRSFLPATYLLYPREVSLPAVELRGRTWVLKQAISSGTKGVSFLDKEAELSFLQEMPYQRLLQEEMENDPFRFSYFDGSGEEQEDTWFARFTAHYKFTALVDLDITARRDKLVHGAKDCLMFSSVLPSDLFGNDGR